jgi:hypothetical protein
MRRILDVRIVRWELKAAYVVAAYLLGFAIGSLLRAAELADVIVGLVAAAIDLTAILLGARVFRGRGEAIEPPRRWWRMTARPTLSWVLGILFLALWVAGSSASPPTRWASAGRRRWPRTTSRSRSSS